MTPPVVVAHEGRNFVTPKGSPRQSLFSQLRKGRSVLRSETTVALSRLRLPVGSRSLILDAGGPTADVWEALAVPESFRRFSLNRDVAREPDVIGDLETNWPMASGVLDLVVSSYVLEHLYEPRRFFSESYRCLKEGGVLVLTTVLIHAKHGSPQDYFRFTDDGLVMLAREVGYDAETLPLLDGPVQTTVSMFSSFLLFPTMRFLAVVAARACDRLIKRLLPFVQENWCVGYVLVARKRG